MTIANNGLNGCKDPKTLPKMPKLKTIVDEALMNCFNLSMLAEMAQLETIGFHALANCYKLRRVHLPKTLVRRRPGAQTPGCADARVRRRPGAHTPGCAHARCMHVPHVSPTNLHALASGLST